MTTSALLFNDVHFGSLPNMTPYVGTNPVQEALALSFERHSFVSSRAGWVLQ
jgi:hypothetical protein